MDTTIEARWMVAGVELSPLWAGLLEEIPVLALEPRDDHWRVMVRNDLICLEAGDLTEATPDELSVNLSDRATHRACLERLAMWCGDDEEKAQAYWLSASNDLGWTLMRASSVGSIYAVRAFPPAITGPGNHDEALAAILTHIGRDHAVRRKLGEEPKPGTLASIGLMQPHEQWWRYDARQHGGAFIEWDRDGKMIGAAGLEGRWYGNVPALAEITDTAGALVAFAAAVLDGSPIPD